MRTLIRGVLLAATLAVAGAASAKDRDEGASFGVSVEASTLGAGLSLGIPLGERFNLRGVYHGYTYELDNVEDDSGATYEGDFELKSAGLMVDVFPFKGAFRFTLGYVSNGNQISLTGRPAGGTFEVGDCTFQSNTPPNELAVDGTVEFASSAPYLGIGWGGNLNSAPGFFMTFDLGVLLSGSPETDLNGRGQARNANAGQPQCGNAVTYQDVSTYPEFQQAVDDAEAEVDEETKDYELWPNIALGVGWRF